MLTPYRQDTNSLYLTEKLNELGVEVRFKLIVGDDRDGLIAATKLGQGGPPASEPKELDIVVGDAAAGKTYFDANCTT